MFLFLSRLLVREKITKNDLPYVFVANCTAYQYELADGRHLFMSNKIKAAFDSSMFLSTMGSPKVLESVLNVERLDFSKTCENVAK